jgi:hypothetical protein
VDTAKLARGETAELHQIDALITKRHDQRVRDEGERRTEEAWAESCRAYEAKRRAELTFEWCEFYERQAQAAIRNGEKIAAENRAKAAKLLETNGHPNGHGGI